MPRHLLHSAVRPRSPQRVADQPHRPQPRRLLDAAEAEAAFAITQPAAAARTVACAAAGKLPFHAATDAVANDNDDDDALLVADVTWDELTAGVAVSPRGHFAESPTFGRGAAADNGSSIPDDVTAMLALCTIADPTWTRDPGVAALIAGANAPFCAPHPPEFDRRHAMRVARANARSLYGPQA